MPFALILPGTFRMGSPANEKGRSSDEVAHPVTLTRPFLLGVYPVTVGEFRACVGASGYQTDAEALGGAHGLVNGHYAFDASLNWRKPGFKQTDRHPVVCLSYDDAQALVAWLNQVEASSGRVYSLPTEAQWEYACRAG